MSRFKKVHSTIDQFSIKTLLLPVFFLLIAIIALLRISQKPELSKAAWFDDNYQYRQRIDIGNTSGSALSDYQVSVSIGTSALINSGKMQSDCDDIRITDQSGKVLPYWLETTTCNTSATKVWPKISSIPTSGTSIFIYYGNPSATSGKTKVGLAENPGLSCKSILNAGDSVGNGNYWIDPTNGNTSDKLQVYCDMTADSGGWMLTTQSMINSEVGSSVTTVKSDGTNGGLVVTNTINNAGSCSGTSYYRVYFNDIIPWTHIRADYQFIGGNSCWSIFGNTAYSANSNLTTYQAGTDTISNQIKMGGAAGNNFDGTTTRCDNDVNNFWHSNQGVGTTRSAQVILRRNSMAAVAGLGTGTACVTNGYPWQYSNIYIREASMTQVVSTASPTNEEKSPAPIAYWKFDEGIGTTVYDSTSNARNGLLSGTTIPSWISENQCVSGKCLLFNGTNNYTTLGSNSDFAYQNGDTWTVNTWFKTSVGITGANGGKTLFTKGVGNAIAGYAIVIGQLNSSGYDNKLGFVIDTSPGNNYALSTSSLPTVNDGNWHLATIVFDAANYTNVSATIYLDGKSYGLVSSSVARSGWATTSSYKAAVGANNVISPSEFFNGFIDDTKIYPYARTAAQIKSDYNTGKSHTTSAKGVANSLGNNNKNSEFLSNGLVGYWKMDEGVGTTALDASGNSYTSTMGTGNSSPSWNTGKFGVGMSFDGVNDYLSAGNPTNITSATNITISAWVNTTATNLTYANGSIAGSGVSRFFLSLSDYSSSTPRATGYVNCNGGWVYPKGSTAINDGLWHLITMTYDGSNVRVYHNGVIDAAPQSCTGALGAASSFYIGAYMPTYHTNANIDEVRVYNRALSASEVSQLYSWAPGPTNYYSMEEGKGSITYDVSGTGATGVFGTGNSAPTWTNGKYGNATKFDGSLQYIGIPDVPPASTNSLTLEAYINPSNVSGSKYIFDQNWGRLGISLQNSEIRFSVMNTGNTGYTINTTGAAIAANTWTHLAATMDNNTNTISVYKNGVLQNSIGFTGPISHGGLATIGAVYRGQGSNYFNGSIDEFRIYNYARTQKQIIEDMNANHPAGGSPVGSQVGYWKFDEGYGTTANNSGSAGSVLNSIFGTGNSAPTWINNAKYNKGLVTATDKYSVATNNHSLDFSNDGFTYSAWIYPTTLNASHNMIMGQFLPYLSINNGKAFMSLSVGSTQRTVTGTTTVTINNWYHVATTFDSQGYLKVYLNGMLDGTSGPYSGGVTNLNNNLYFGTWHSGFTYPFNGTIDEAKVYNYALTPDEIKLDYNRGQAIQLGALSSGTGNTTPSNSSSQLYCIPGDTTTCSTPIAEWNFEEGVGATANDSSGNSNSCTLNSSTYKPGKTGNSIYLSGNTSYASCGTTLNPVNPITLEAWVNISSLAVNNPIISKDGTWLWYIRNSGGIQLSMYGVGVSEIWTPYTFNPNTWYFVSSSVDSSGNVKHYINGQLATNTQSGVTSLNSNANTFTIGKWSSSYLNGQLDQVKVFNYVRTPAQIALDYNRGAPVGWWKFDECQGSTAFDSSGIGNTGLIAIGAGGSQPSLGTCAVGATTAWGVGASGKYNSSLNFDGTDDYVSIPSNSSLSISTETTISAWVKTTTASQKPILSTRTSSGAMYFGLSLGRAFVYYNPATPPSVTTTKTVNNGAWHNITYTHTGNTYYFYIDGVLESTSSQSGFSTTTDIVSIGRDVANGEYFPGQIDDVRIYNYALTSTQIKTLYNGGNAVNFSPASGSP